MTGEHPAGRETVPRDRFDHQSRAEADEGVAILTNARYSETLLSTAWVSRSSKEFSRWRVETGIFVLRLAAMVIPRFMARRYFLYVAQMSLKYNETTSRRSD